MFTPDPNITDLKVREKGIYKILFSMNIHQVATPDLSAEDARCYIIFFREGASLSAYIGLYLPRTDRRFYYTYSSNPFPFEAESEVEDDARKFAEDMGFLLDEINIGGMSLEEKNRWIEEQPIFGQRKQPEEKPAAQAVPSAPEARPAPHGGEAPAQAVQPAAAAPQPPASQPLKKPAPVQQAAQPKPQMAEAQEEAPQAAEAAQPVAPPRPDDVIQQAVKAGVVKPPKPQLKKKIQTASGVVSRDKEALARLLASF